jgi:hypothetical protein
MNFAIYAKEGGFSVLRKYVPEAIFQDTNLPYVKVIVEGEKATIIEPEHPELALSLLIPARVIFRYHPGGHIIPILQSSYGPIATELAKSYKIVPCKDTPSRYMEEYEYVLKKLKLDQVRCLLLSEVVLEKSNLFRERDFPMELGCHGYAPRGRYIYRLPLGELNEPLENVWQITSKTIAYPRLGVSISGQTYKRWSDELLGVTLRYQQHAHVIKYIYGEDTRIHYRHLNSASLSDLKNITLKVKRGVIDEVRFFENNNTPCVLGYEVKDTQSLEMYPRDLLDRRLKKFIDSFVDCNDSPESCLQEPLKFYTALTVCQTFVNMLLYVLTKDLYTRLSTTQNTRFQYLADLAEVALLYSELQLNRSICEVLAMPIDEALKELKVRLRGAFEELKKAYDQKRRRYNMGALVLVAIFKGQRARELLRSVSKVDDTSMDGYINIVIQRFKDLVENLSGRQYEDEKGHYWSLGVLKYVFIHTLNHHILKQVALSSGLTPEYLMEGLDMYGDGEVSGLVYENVSGGVRAIEQALRAWGFLNKKDVMMDQEKIEKLLLQLGECSLGSAEDLLYLEYTMPKKPKGISLICTPWELEEYYKVRFNFKEDVRRLSEFWDLDPIKLEENMVGLLKHTDTILARFSNYEQLISFYLKNIGTWNALDELVKKVATASFEARNLSIDIDSLLRKLKASLIGSEYIEEKDERVKEIMKQIRILLNTVRPIFLRLIPRSCNPSCAMCYFNRESCVYGDPYTQIYMLNRRLLKLYAFYIVEAVKNNCSEDCLALVRLNEEDVCVCL